jgi:hypothetical protein
MKRLLLFLLLASPFVAGCATAQVQRNQWEVPQPDSEGLTPLGHVVKGLLPSLAQLLSGLAK